MKNDLLTAHEVADRLTVSVRTVWRWAGKGQLPPPIHIGGITRWRMRDIEAFIRQTVYGSAPPARVAGREQMGHVPQHPGHGIDSSLPTPG
jgi:predicted DNA-binding transcriptional regulator AlpA